MSDVPSTIDIEVTADGIALPGSLGVPAEARGLVIFAHGSGSSRLSPRNTAVARSLVERGSATLLFDLLTPLEAADRRNVFDIPLLGDRMIGATVWVRQRPEAAGLPVGYFGASTGSAAALVAAAELGAGVSAVVSRGGRPDLAGPALTRVTAPTLLLVGSLDTRVLELNRNAQACMTCDTKLVTVAGATHLFEEPGTMEIVADEAASWFEDHFDRRRPGS